MEIEKEERKPSDRLTERQDGCGRDEIAMRSVITRAGTVIYAETCKAQALIGRHEAAMREAFLTWAVCVNALDPVGENITPFHVWNAQAGTSHGAYLTLMTQTRLARPRLHLLPPHPAFDVSMCTGEAGGLRERYLKGVFVARAAELVDYSKRTAQSAGQAEDEDDDWQPKTLDITIIAPSMQERAEARRLLKAWVRDCPQLRAAYAAISSEIAKARKE